MFQNVEDRRSSPYATIAEIEDAAQKLCVALSECFARSTLSDSDQVEVTKLLIEKLTLAAGHLSDDEDEPEADFDFDTDKSVDDGHLDDEAVELDDDD